MNINKNTYDEYYCIYSKDPCNSSEIMDIHKLYDTLKLHLETSSILCSNCSKRNSIFKNACEDCNILLNIIDIPNVFTKGLIFYNLEQYTTAINYFTEELLINPKNYKSYYYQGLCCEQSNKFIEAIDYYIEYSKSAKWDTDNYYHILYVFII